jgi:hypothetical protein
LISHDGTHLPRDRKDSVPTPPTGTSTDGSISTDPGAAADVTGVTDLGAAESGGREAAVAEMFGSEVDGAMLIAAGAVDRRLEAEGGYLAERREGQRVEHPARLEPADSG